MDRVWDMTVANAATPLTSYGVVCDGALQCRRLDASTGRYHPNAPMQAFEAWMTSAPASAMESLYGFRAEFAENGGEIRFRVSTDGGSTWSWWDGAAWSAATLAGEWNTESEVDEHIPALAVAPGRNLAIAVKVTPAADTPRVPADSPLVYRAAIYGEWNCDWVEDLARSVKTHVAKYARQEATWRVSLTSASSLELPAAPDENLPVTAYDLTADPGRTNDIAGSLSGRDLNLTQTVTGVVEVVYSRAHPVHIATDVDYQLSELPAIVLQLPSVREVRELRQGDRALDWARSRYAAMATEHPVMLEAQVTVSVQADNALEVLEMQAAVDRALQQCRTVRSVGTAEQFVVTDYGPSNDGSQISGGLHVRQTQVTIRGQAWLHEGEELDLVREAFIGVGSMTQRDLEVQAAP